MTHLFQQSLEVRKCDMPSAWHSLSAVSPPPFHSLSSPCKWGGCAPPSQGNHEETEAQSRAGEEPRLQPTLDKPFPLSSALSLKLKYHIYFVFVLPILLQHLLCTRHSARSAPDVI